MAEALAASIKEGGCEVSLKKINEATLEDMRACDGLLLGSPCYFGCMAAEMKAFIDESIALFGKGELVGKPAGGLCQHRRHRRRGRADPVVHAPGPSYSWHGGAGFAQGRPLSDPWPSASRTSGCWASAPCTGPSSRPCARAWPGRALTSSEAPVCLLPQGLAGAAPHDGPPAVLVARGRIAALGGEALSAGAPRREMPGLWLSAAPIDAHVHLQMRSGLEAALAACAWAGLAAVRDLGHRSTQATPAARAKRPWLWRPEWAWGAAGEAAYWLAHPVAGAEAFARAGG